jgi:hypothetical protein
LKHSYIAVAIYKRTQMKHLKHMSETIVKTSERHLKTILTQHPDGTLAADV